MRFSVVIPTLDRREMLSRTLASVFDQDFPLSEFEVIVVVDGSTDGTLEMLRDLRPSCGFHVVDQPNRGLPAARNSGVAAAQGEFVLLLDDDIICEQSLLAKHAEAHGDDRNLVVFGPVPLHPDSPPSLAVERWAAWSRQFVERIESEQACGPPAAFWMAATAPAVNRSLPRALFTALGGCDETLRDCHEDWDLGIRLWKAGAGFRFVPDAVAYHFYDKSERAIVQTESRLFARGELALARKHPEYRPMSLFAGMAAGRWRHRAFVTAATSTPISLEPVLRPVFLALNALRDTPVLNRAAIRALEYRASLETYREATRVAGSRRALRAEFGMRLPVLAYHHVGTPKPGNYPDLSVTAERFERQVRWLSRMGYRGIRAADWLAWCRTGLPLPDKPVLITFDDAYEDITRHALPVLRQYGFGAVVFVVTGQIGGANHWDSERGSAIHAIMGVDQIRHWAEQGIEFGAHSQTHPDLTSLPIAAVEEELVRSKEELASVLGRDVALLAYPYGRHNASVNDAARRHFEMAFTTQQGLNDLSTDLHLLKRSCVGLRDSVADLECLLRWGLRPLPHIRAKVRLRQRMARAVRWATG